MIVTKVTLSDARLWTSWDGWTAESIVTRTMATGAEVAVGSGGNRKASSPFGNSDSIRAGSWIFSPVPWW